MNREQRATAQIPTYRRWNRSLKSREELWNCRGRITISSGFYLGIGMLVLLLIVGALALPSAKPLIDQHANPEPATRLPAQVLTSPGSNLYHTGSCPYAHRDSKLLSTDEALRHGLVPCPYCIGNSSARLIPEANLRQAHQ